MYNLNVNLATSAANAVNNLLSVENSCTTPKTPDILNSLIAMTNPLDSYTFENGEARKKFHPNNGNMSSDSNSSSCSQESRTACINGPTSVQQTCSQLIKAGLKLTIEQKRKIHSDSDDLLDLDKFKRIKRNESESEEDKSLTNSGLTPEDEERRRRRRERNKIAATKCRLKKRERTANLIAESETLEAQNVELKNTLQELQNQNRHLVDILSVHKATCQKNIRAVTARDAPIFNRLPQHSVIESNHSYSRPASVDTSYRTQNVETYNRPASTGTYEAYRSAQYVGKMTPSIIVETINEDDYQTNLTDLDNPIETYSYNNQQCHNYPTSQQSYGSHGIDGCMA